eukprot:463060-Amphidinium_carterae.1
MRELVDPGLANTQLPPRFHQVTMKPPVGLPLRRLWKIGWILLSWRKLEEDQLLKLALRERHICIAQSLTENDSRPSMVMES